MSGCCFSSLPPLSTGQQISGELKQWHDVTLTFDGPATSESAEPNPFLFYRLNVTFTKGSKKYVVPGYYAADGNAAETSAKSRQQVARALRSRRDRRVDLLRIVSQRPGSRREPRSERRQARSLRTATKGSLKIAASDKSGTRSSSAGNAGIRGRTLCALPRLRQVLHSDRHAEPGEFLRLLRVRRYGGSRRRKESSEGWRASLRASCQGLEDW